MIFRFKGDFGLLGLSGLGLRVLGFLGLRSLWVLGFVGLRVFLD